MAARTVGRRGAARLLKRAGRLCLAALLCIGGALGTARAAAQSPLAEGPSGLPLPRFVTLKSGEVNVRGGPGTDYRVRFILKRAGLPVEIVQEFSNWRRIRDWEGDDGWVHHSLLSADRSALVVPWEAASAIEGAPQGGSQGAGSGGAPGADGGREPVDVHAQPDRSAAVVARLEPKVLARVRSCDGSWCLVAGTGWDGFVEQDLLWGVYPGEVFD